MGKTLIKLVCHFVVYINIAFGTRLKKFSLSRFLGQSLPYSLCNALLTLLHHVTLIGGFAKIDIAPLQSYYSGRFPTPGPGHFPLDNSPGQFSPDNSPSQLGQFPLYRSKPNLKITHIHTCMHTCIHIYIHAYTHAYTHRCMHTRIYAYNTYMHAYIHIFMHTYTLKYIHIY